MSNFSDVNIIYNDLNKKINKGKRKIFSIKDKVNLLKNFIVIYNRLPKARETFKGTDIGAKYRWIHNHPKKYIEIFVDIPIIYNDLLKRL